MRTADEIAADWWSTLRPPPLRTVSQWADAERVLTTDSSAQPGRWRTEVTPYLREPMDRLSASDPCERVVLCVASQTGKTELGLNAEGYWSDDAPGPILHVVPRDEDLKKTSRQRIAPLIRSSPALAAKFASPKGRAAASSMYLREFSGGVLMMASAQSPAGLASMPVRYLVLDEIDRYPASAGSEGDPVSLAVQRTVSFSRRKILLTSTPTTLEGSRIWREYQRTGQRRYAIPCPHCGVPEPWEWEMLRWDPGKPSTAMLYCTHCGTGIDERDKRELLQLGQWTPDRPDIEDGSTYGYRLTALCAPYGWLPVSWGALAKRWEATASDPLERQVMVNVALALPFDDAATSTVDPDGLAERAEDYGARVAAGGLVLTAGVDVQADRVEASVWAWGAGEEAWLVDHAVIAGDPSGPALWDDLDRYLLQRWPHASGATLTVDAVCVDSGYMATTVQAWCAERRGRRVYAVKGSSSTDGNRAVWPTRGSRGKRGSGHAVYLLGVHAAKDALWGRLQREPPGPGSLHFPAGDGAVDLAYYEQIMAERVRVEGGRRRWHKPRGARSEALDCWVYAYAALLSMGATSRTLASGADRLAVLADAAQRAPAPTPAQPAPQPAQQPRTRPRPQRGGGSWLDRGSRLR